MNDKILKKLMGCVGSMQEQTPLAILAKVTFRAFALCRNKMEDCKLRVFHIGLYMEYDLIEKVW